MDSVVLELISIRYHKFMMVLIMIQVEDTSNKPTLAEDLHHSLQGKAGKMKDAAKKATDLAKKKAGPMYAACQPQQS